MKKRSRAGREPIKAQRRKTSEPKSRNAPEAVGRSKSAPAQEDTAVARLTRELSEAREQQTATSDVLQVISSFAGELEPVFQTILANATRLCEARFANLLLYEGGPFRVASLYGAPPAWAALRRREPIVQPGRKDDPLCRVAATKQLQHVADIRTEKSYKHGPIVALADVAGARTLLVVPMLKENELLGVIGIYRQEIRPLPQRGLAASQPWSPVAFPDAAATRRLQRAVRGSKRRIVPDGRHHSDGDCERRYNPPKCETQLDPAATRRVLSSVRLPSLYQHLGLIMSRGHGRVQQW